MTRLHSLFTASGCLLRQSVQVPALALWLMLFIQSTAWAENQRLVQIAGRLDAVAVYYLVHPDGSSHTLSDADSKAVAPVFFYRASAESLQHDLANQDNPLAVQVKEARLGSIYLEMKEQTPGGTRFALIGDPWQVGQARTINQDDAFDAVPVFSVRERTTGAHLTMLNREGSRVLPLFLEAQRVRAALEIVKKQDPAESENLSVVAVPLQTVVRDMVSGRLPHKDVVFIPPQ